MATVELQHQCRLQMILQGVGLKMVGVCLQQREKTLGRC